MLLLQVLVQFGILLGVDEVQSVAEVALRIVEVPEALVRDGAVPQCLDMRGIEVERIGKVLQGVTHVTKLFQQR